MSIEVGREYIFKSNNPNSSFSKFDGEKVIVIIDYNVSDGGPKKYLARFASGSYVVEESQLMETTREDMYLHAPAPWALKDDCPQPRYCGGKLISPKNCDRCYYLRYSSLRDRFYCCITDYPCDHRCENRDKLLTMQPFAW